MINTVSRKYSKFSTGLTVVRVLKKSYFFNYKLIKSSKKIDRSYWSSFDPINLSEAFFAIANVLTFARLCIFLPVSQQLGPLQITLGIFLS